jgi:CBS domain-containing protein
MKIDDLMDRTVPLCHPEETLDEAIRRLWDSNCSVLPVVDRARGLLGILSERDVCLSLHLDDARPSQMTVGDAMRAMRLSCRPDAEADATLGTMKRMGVRHLPVTDSRGRVLGMVSGADLEAALREEAEGGTLLGDGTPG